MLKDDVKSLNQLLPVIRDIADNETDEIILNYYREIIYSTNRSIYSSTQQLGQHSNINIANIHYYHITLFTTDCSIGEE